MGKGLRKPQILIVDDDPHVAKMFSKMLGGDGYTVTTADSGSAAFVALQKREFHLLILDLAMPQPDGFELLKQLRAYRPELRILVVSGAYQGAVLKAAEMVGATAALSKLDAPAQLLPIVRQILK